jgi:periplasmic divalent cation tolerance protein
MDRTESTTGPGWRGGEVVIVLTTMPDDDRAAELAATLVAERLAACVNVHDRMSSIYRWKGAVEREAERQLVIKTTSDCLPRLEKRLRELHPYELPEFIALRASAGAAYAEWVRAAGA